MTRTRIIETLWNKTNKAVELVREKALLVERASEEIPDSIPSKNIKLRPGKIEIDHCPDPSIVTRVFPITSYIEATTRTLDYFSIKNDSILRITIFKD